MEQLQENAQDEQQIITRATATVRDMRMTASTRMDTFNLIPVPNHPIYSEQEEVTSEYLRIAFGLKAAARSALQ